MRAVVIGCGRVGSAVAKGLATDGWDVTVIDENEDALARLGTGWHGGFVVGHGMDTTVLESAGAAEADAAVVATDGDNTNIVIGQVLQKRYEIDTVVVRVLDPAQGAVLRRSRHAHRLPDADCDLRAARHRAHDRPSTERGILMYVIVAGGGKVGSNVTRSLLEMGHEVTLIEQRPDRFARLEEEFGPVVMRGDATEIHVLERAGIARPPELVLAVTGDDEDNLVISQIAKEGYGVRKAIARVNNPRNQQHFDLLGITQTVCATTSILGLVEHEMPEHGLVRLLELQKEGLVVAEVQIEADSPVAGKRAGGLGIPYGLAAHLGVSPGPDRARRAEHGDAPRRPGARDRPAGIRSRAPARAARRPSVDALAPASEAPVVAREQHDDRDDLEAARPTSSPIIVSLETSPSGCERAHGPGDSEPGADVAERGRRRRRARRASRARRP